MYVQYDMNTWFPGSGREPKTTTKPVLYRPGFYIICANDARGLTTQPNGMAHGGRQSDTQTTPRNLAVGGVRVSMQ